MKKFLAFLLCAATLAGFAGCSDEDEDGIPSELVGTWEGSHTYYNPVGGYKTNYIEFTFNAERTGTCQITAQTYFAAAAFSYTIKGSSITCIGICYGSDNSDSGDEWSASLEWEGGKLTAGSPYTNYGELTKVD